MSRNRGDSLDVLADAVAGALAARPGRRKGATSETRAVRFARGLAMGALVGAALTGLLRYRAGRRHDRGTSRTGTGGVADGDA